MADERVADEENEPKGIDEKKEEAPAAVSEIAATKPKTEIGDKEIEKETDELLSI